MKLCTFSTGQVHAHLGVLDKSAKVLDVTALMAGDARFSTMQALIAAQDETLPLLRAVLERQDVPANCLYAQDQIRFLPPLEPSQIRCFSVYVQHMKNAFAQVIKNTRGVIPNLLLRHLGLMKIPKYFFESPVYYKGTRLSLSGHQSGIRRPRADCRLDYEAELALVIGVRGKNIAERDAMKHVFGYLIFNDFSERTQLLKEMQSRPSAGPAKGKDFDGSNALGPWLVTCDEIANPENLAVQVRVNGQVVGRGSTNQMSHSIEKIVSYASWSETLYPGEMLATGCVPNCAGIEHWRFLQDGDQVEVEIEGLGSMVNSVLSVQPD